MAFSLILKHGSVLQGKIRQSVVNQTYYMRQLFKIGYSRFLKQSQRFYAILCAFARFSLWFYYFSCFFIIILLIFFRVLLRILNRSLPVSILVSFCVRLFSYELFIIINPTHDLCADMLWIIGLAGYPCFIVLTI